MIAFRVDANLEISIGHLMRCLSIAIELRNRGYKCIFIIADDKFKGIISQYDFVYIVLNTFYQNMDSEVNQVKKVISKFKIKKILIDSYYITESYLKSLSNLTKIIYIDDLGIFFNDIDMLINSAFYCDLFNYEDKYKNSSTQLLLGPAYIPLRQEFKNVPKNVLSYTIKKILLIFGGTDKYNIMGKLLARIKKQRLLNDIEFHLIVGRGNPNKNNLYKLSSMVPNIILYKNLDYVSELMKNSDLAVAAGGLSNYELCALGVPSISVSFSDNQLYSVKRLDEMGIIDYAGDIRYGEELLFLKIINKIQEYIHDPQKRFERSKKMQKLIDGRGVERLSEEILKL